MATVEVDACGSMAASRARPHIFKQQADVGLLLQLQTQDTDSPDNGI